jgi:hypothetical protein
MFERRGRLPQFLRLMGHDHFSATLHLNTADEDFGRQILRFVRLTLGEDRSALAQPAGRPA